MLCAAVCIYGRGCLSLSVDARCLRASRASVYFLFPEHLQTTARVCIMFPLLVLSEMCERMCYILGCASDCASAGLIPEGGLHACVCVCVCVCVYVQWGKALLQVMGCYIRLYLVSDSAPLLQPFCNSILSIVVSSFIFLIFWIYSAVFFCQDDGLLLKYLKNYRMDGHSCFPVDESCWLWWFLWCHIQVC